MQSVSSTHALRLINLTLARSLVDERARGKEERRGRSGCRIDGESPSLPAQSILRSRLRIRNPGDAYPASPVKGRRHCRSTAAVIRAIFHVHLKCLVMDLLERRAGLTLVTTILSAPLFMPLSSSFHTHFHLSSSRLATAPLKEFPMHPLRPEDCDSCLHALLTSGPGFEMPIAWVPFVPRTGLRRLRS